MVNSKQLFRTEHDGGACVGSKDDIGTMAENSFFFLYWIPLSAYLDSWIKGFCSKARHGNCNLGLGPFAPVAISSQRRTANSGFLWLVAVHFNSQ